MIANSNIKTLFATLVAVLALSATSCSMSEDPIYDTSPTTRLNSYLSAVQTTLAKPANGWEMRVYPGRTMDWGGYTLWAKFDTAGNVTTASEVYGTDETFTSPYKLDATNQPTLTFDVFNKAVHLFAAPNLKALINEDKAAKGTASRLARFADASPVVGLAGDYALRILSHSDTAVVLAGARTGIRYVLTPADSTAWSKQVQAVQTTSDNYGLPLLQLALAGKNYAGRMHYSRRQLFLTDSLGNDILSRPYRYTQDGLELYEPLTLDGVTFQTLHAVANASVPTLQTADSSVTLTANLKPLNRTFTELVDVWDIVYNFTPVEMGGRFAEGFGMFSFLPQMGLDVNHSVMFSSIGTLRRMGMGFGIVTVTRNNAENTDMQLTFVPLKYTLVEGTTNEVELAYDADRVDPSSLLYMETLYTYLPGLGFANYGTLHQFGADDLSPRRFRIEADDPFTPAVLTLIDTSNPENFIRLKRATTANSD